jgi:hypothetical protein
MNLARPGSSGASSLRIGCSRRDSKTLHAGSLTKRPWLVTDSGPWPVRRATRLNWRKQSVTKAASVAIGCPLVA